MSVPANKMDDYVKKLDKSEENTMRILELYSELLTEGRNDLVEPGAASLQSASSEFVLQKRMTMEEDEEN